MLVKWTSKVNGLQRTHRHDIYLKKVIRKASCRFRVRVSLILVAKGSIYIKYVSNCISVRGLYPSQQFT